jgi:hypothetical protein
MIFHWSMGSSCGLTCKEHPLEGNDEARLKQLSFWLR